MSDDWLTIVTYELESDLKSSSANTKKLGSGHDSKVLLIELTVAPAAKPRITIGNSLN